jgi:predicted transposase/invertase (TIGR01784 family)
MAEITNPHDKFFRQIWSDKENAVDFLKNYLPSNLLQKINLDTLSIEKDSFVDKNLKESFSDLLYKVQFDQHEGFIYVLFEHKSHPDKYTVLQLLKYMVSIWELFLKQNKNTKLPFILPLVIYHGMTKWNFGESLSAIIDLPEKDWLEYLPDFKFLLYDLTRYSDEEIKGAVISRAALMLLKSVKNPDFIEHLPRIIRLFSELVTQQRGLDLIRTILYYITETADKIQPEELNRLIRENLKSGADIMPTIAERWIQEGIEKGKTEGKIEGKIEDALSFHRLGVSAQIISKATGLSMERLEEIFKEEKGEIQ